MKINISYPSTGCQKVIEVDDDKKLRAFYDKRMSQEVEGDVLGDDFKGYIFRISGGNDKEGFAMKQGILTSQRVRILFSDGHSCFRERRPGERKRKSVRGCIVSSALSVLNLVIVKKGDNEIPGLTDQTKPRRLGPKRASRIRKLFNLSKEDDVRQYVIRRQIVKDGKKPTSKAPKIQRLVTPARLQHKRQLANEKRKRYEKSQKEAQEYNQLVAKLLKEKRTQKLARKRSASRRESSKPDAEKKPKTDAKQAKPKQDKPEAEKKQDKPKQDKPKQAAEKKQDKPKQDKPKQDKPKQAAEKKQDKPKQDKPKQDKPTAEKKQDKPAQKKQDKPPAAEKKQDKPAQKKQDKPTTAAPAAKADKPKSDQPKKGKK